MMCTYAVTLSVDDGDGGVGSDTQVITATLIAADGGVGEDFSGDEGTEVTLSAMVTDPGLEGFAYHWTVTASNGQVIDDGYGETFSFTPDDDGTYAVTLRVDDGDGGSDCDTQVITARNVDPTVVLGEDFSSDEGTEVTLSAAVTDPGLEEFAYHWTVTASNGQVVEDGYGETFTFTPGDDGTYTVRLRVDDGDGGSACDTKSSRPPTSPPGSNSATTSPSMKATRSGSRPTVPTRATTRSRTTGR